VTIAVQGYDWANYDSINQGLAKKIGFDNIYNKLNL